MNHIYRTLAVDITINHLGTITYHLPKRIMQQPGANSLPAMFESNIYKV